MSVDIFVTPPSISWCQDSARVIVIDESTGQAVSLSGLDAAVWTWFSLSYAYQDVLAFVQAYLNLPAEEARRQLNQGIDGWVELGLLSPEAAPPEEDR